MMKEKIEVPKGRIRPGNLEDEAAAKEFVRLEAEMKMILFELKQANDSWKGQILTTTIGRFRMRGRVKK